ncbi:golgin subfamily A member 3-like [Haliotis rubra]|uniref:golgin subfamily A member 3-like n=1 Tax=Haliotis rubra TaxID=36100 RepID=UPI001EE5AF25|nr:golgin subfamily A member 3-like [Haliotis rubra]
MARAATEKGNMGEDEETIIRLNTPAIEGCLEVKDINSILLAKGILDFTDRQEIESSSTRIERAKRFIHIIINRGPNAFKEFIFALREKGYKDLADRLSQEETAHELTRQIKDGQGVKKLHTELEELRIRLGHMEDKAGKTKHEVDSMRGGIQYIATSLEKIETLSKESETAFTTIHLMQQQLQKKDDELTAAREEIQKLKADVLKLEQDNAVLRVDLQHQSDNVNKLKDQMATVTDKNVFLEKEINNTKKQLTVVHDNFTETMEKQKKEMETMKKAVQAMQGPLTSKRVAVASRPIVPRNRFQRK